jgi:capsular polysaccharide biosynthesis protein
MSANDSDNWRVRASEKLFAALILLFPKKFRARYGEPMRQFFRDECREAQRSNRELIRLWCRTAADLMRSIPREHFNALTQKKKGFMKQWISGVPQLSFGRLFEFSFIGLVAAVMTFTAVAPRIYQSTARIEVQRGGANGEGYDPYFVQTQFERIQSRAVLEPVIRELNLDKEFAAINGGSRPSMEEELAMLRNMVSLRQSRNTALIEIRVYSTRSQLAEQIANSIAANYRALTEHAGTGARVLLLDAAVANERPIRPNVPLNMTLGLLISLPLAACIALILRSIFKSFPKPLAIA